MSNMTVWSGNNTFTDVAWTLDYINLLHLPSTLRFTESFNASNRPILISMKYSCSSPDVTFDRTKEATNFDRSPVHVMRFLYLAQYVLMCETPFGNTEARNRNAEDGVTKPHSIVLNFSLSASANSYFHWKVKLDPTTALWGLEYFVSKCVVTPSTGRK